MGTHPIFESDFDCLTDFRMAQVKETLNIVCDGKVDTVTVELHRQELHPYVVIILKSGKAHPVGLIDLDHTKAEISKDDSKRFTLSTDSTNTDKNKTIDFVTKTDERANYWADVFNQKLHFEHKPSASNMPTLAEEEASEESDNEEESEDVFNELVDRLRKVALEAQASKEELDEMDDEVSDMTASFHTAARKDRSNSIRSIRLRLQKYDMNLKVKA